MQVSNDSPSTDYIHYFTEQLPIDLAKMAVLRDELAKRQGAMSAVEATLADREQAKKELSEAKAFADGMREKVIAEQQALAEEVSAFKNKQAEFEKIYQSRSKEMELRQQSLDAKEVSLANQSKTLEELSQELNSRSVLIAEQENAIQIKIKTLQEKIASLSA